MLTAAFPKISMPILAWFALVPLLVALRERSAGDAFKTGFIAGLVHYLTLLYWVVFTMRVYGYLPWWQSVSLLFLLAAYLALYPGIFALAVVRTCRNPIHLIWLAPFFWVALEYVRTFLLTGFPWGLVGYSQFNRLHIIQISDMFGVYGVSFLVVLVNTAIYVLLLAAAGKPWRGVTVSRQQAFKTTAFALALITLTIVYGRYRIAAMDAAMDKAAKTRVALIQGNIDQARKWDPAFQISTTKKYVDLTLSAVDRQPDLVVWPETATPFYFEASPKLTQLVTDAIRKAGVYLLVGSPSVQAVGDQAAYYNSAYLVAPDGSIAGRYDKVHLVPFGEYVPLKQLLSFVGKMVAQVGDFSPGKKGHTLAWGPDRPKLGVQICFEIIFPDLCRSLVKNGAGLLVNLTNDAWFDRSSAAEQHFSMAAFRAIENRRSLVRCANTGISGVVDPVGRVVRRTELFSDAVVVKAVPALTEQALYTRMGDFLPQIGLIIMGILMLLPSGKGVIGIKRGIDRKVGRRR
ncbi:apolipoprotein N-acyltransferase [Desulfosarcina cetonica]|uniref:apolipoprotein N-acyltransferase n=1 Tax=Desulfosarcina cetonica TaxID=90730 RepID=UPI0006D1A02B|nr:apolipoprotein N-acyltransferase [Desulfosarcina cetonica]